MGVEFTVTVTDAGATVAFQKIAAAEDNLDATTKKVTAGYEKLNLTARKLYQETRTPAERHNQRMEKLNALVKSGKIDQDLYARSVKRASDELARTQQAGVGAFGPQMLRHVGALAGALGVGGGVIGALAAFRRFAGEAHQEIKGLAAEMRQTESILKQVWQVSANQDAYEGLTSRMKMAALSEGLTKEQAGGLAFTLQSARRIEALPTIAKSSRFMDSETAADFYKTISADTAWGKEAYSPEQMLSGLISAADVSSFDTGGMASATTKVAPLFKNLGATPDEILAVMAAISTSYESSDEMSTGARALAVQLNRWKQTQLDKGKFSPDQLGSGILETFDAMRTLDPRSYQQTKLSEMRFGHAATSLEGARELAGTYAQTVGGAFADDSIFQEKTRTPAELSRLRLRRTAEAQKKASFDRKAQMQLDLETMIQANEALAGATGSPLGTEKFAATLADTGATLGATEFATEQAAERAMSRLATKYPDVFQRHLADLVPSTQEHAALGGMGGGYGGGTAPPTETRVNLPGAPTQEQQTALLSAIAEILERIDEKTPSSGRTAPPNAAQLQENMRP